MTIINEDKLILLFKKVYYTPKGERDWSKYPFMYENNEIYKLWRKYADKWNKRKVKCMCGSTISLNLFYSHKKSKKHQVYLDENDIEMNTCTILDDIPDYSEEFWHFDISNLKEEDFIETVQTRTKWEFMEEYDSDDDKHIAIDDAF